MNKFNRLMPELDSDRLDARARYERVVRIVRYNTAPGQLLPVHTVTVVASHCGLDADAVRRSLQAAVENDDLLRVRRDGVAHYAIAAVGRLISVIERDDVSQSEVAECNRLIDQCRGGSA